MEKSIARAHFRTDVGDWQEQFWSLFANEKISLEVILLGGGLGGILNLFDDLKKDKPELWSEKIRKSILTVRHKTPASTLFYQGSAGGEFRARVSTRTREFLKALLENNSEDISILEPLNGENDLYLELVIKQRMTKAVQVKIKSLPELVQGIPPPPPPPFLLSKIS